MDESQGRFQVGEDQRAAAERVKELRLSFIAQQQRAGEVFAVALSTSRPVSRFIRLTRNEIFL